MVSVWSAMFLGGLSIVGTMIMRKFHNSMAVGFFLGVTVGCSQWLAVLSLVYISYSRDVRLADAEENGQGVPSIQSGKEETLLAIVAALQALLLGSFAAILAAHRSEILDKQQSGNAIGSGGGAAAAAATTGGTGAEDAEDSVASYDPPMAGSSGRA
jgi:ABC-type Fe3+-siderophore transport system permease subunit